jgi:glycosyltransferase involved in cell wall biosynthesis
MSDLRDHATDISVVIPLFNEQESLEELYDNIRGVMRDIDKTYEIIFVDDGSTDDSADLIESLSDRDHNVKLIQFRKNYGKSEGLNAGFAASSGRYVVTMDADLQDDPGEIPNLIAKLEEGYDLVSGWKKVRHDPLTKKVSSRIYNFFTSVFSGIRLHDFNCGLKAYRQRVVKSLNVYGDLHRYLPVVAHRTGFRVTEIPVKHHPRKFGESKFGSSRLFRGAFDLLTITFLTRYRKRPLHLFGGLGVFFFIVGFAISLFLAIQKIFYDANLSNRPLLFLGVLLIIVGIQFISIGLLGEMITAQKRDRSFHHIKRTIGFKDRYND